MNDLISEISAIENHFALVDQCQCLASDGYSVKFCLAMCKTEKALKDNLQHEESKELFEKLSKIFFGHVRELED